MKKNDASNRRYGNVRNVKRDRKCNYNNGQAAAGQNGGVSIGANTTSNKSGFKNTGISANNHNHQKDSVIYTTQDTNCDQQHGHYQTLRNDRPNINGNTVPLPSPVLPFPAVNDNLHQMGPYIQVAAPAYPQYIPCYPVDGNDPQSMFMAPVQYGMVQAPAASMFNFTLYMYWINGI